MDPSGRPIETEGAESPGAGHLLDLPVPETHVAGRVSPAHGARRVLVQLRITWTVPYP